MSKENQEEERRYTFYQILLPAGLVSLLMWAGIVWAVLKVFNL